MPRPAWEAVLQDGTVFVLAEITPTEMVMVSKLAGNEPVMAVRLKNIARAGLGFSLRRFGGRELTQTEARAQAPTLFRKSRDAALAQTRWLEIHHPTDAEIEALEVGAACTVGTDGDELWTFTLPGRNAPDRVVTMVDVGEETVDAVIREATGAAKSEAAQGFTSLVGGASRALRTVDGKPVAYDDLKGPKWDAHFSVRETYLLGRAYQIIHGAPPGEATPVPTP